MATPWTITYVDNVNTIYSAWLNGMDTWANGVYTVLGSTYTSAGFKTSLGLQNVTNESKATMFTSPTFTGNAILGTPASGTLISCTGLPLTTGVTGTLPVANGGTNIASYTAGDVLYASDATTLTKLAKGTASQVLTMNALATAPEWAANTGSIKAWVNFNGTGTVAIRASGNVSSITDNGVGDYTVNFTTAMSDANYVCHVTTTGSSSTQVVSIGAIRGAAVTGATLKTTTQVEVVVGVGNASGFSDHAEINVSIFR